MSREQMNASAESELLLSRPGRKSDFHAPLACVPAVASYLVTPLLSGLYPSPWVSFHKSMWVPASALSESLASLPGEQGGLKDPRLHMCIAPGNRKCSVSTSSYCSCSNIRSPNFDDNQSLLTLQPFLLLSP